MDVAILGVGESAQRLARICLTGGGTEGQPSPADSTVSLYGTEATAVMDAIDGVEEELRAHGVPAPESSAERIDGTTDLDTAVGDATVVLDTRVDTIETTRERLAAVEAHVDPETVIAIRMGENRATALAVALERPERAMGYALIAESYPGVFEVVRADQTDDEYVNSLSTFAENHGWHAVTVADAPGIVSTRLQFALEVEAMRAVETAVADPAAIDAVMTEGFDHSEGPLARADRAGLERRLEQLETLAAELGEQFEPPAVLQRKVEAGQLGQKSGEGFRQWENDQPVDGIDTHE